MQWKKIKKVGKKKHLHIIFISFFMQAAFKLAMYESTIYLVCISFVMILIKTIHSYRNTSYKML